MYCFGLTLYPFWRKEKKNEKTANHLVFNKFTKIEKYVKLMLTLAFREGAVPIQLAWWFESQELVLMNPGRLVQVEKLSRKTSSLAVPRN